MAFNKRILHLIEQAGALMQTPRSGLRSLGNSFDTIASHSHHVSVIAYIIAREEKLTHNEALKASTMATFHDLAEARTLDLDFISKHYTKTDEEKAISDQFRGLGFGKDLKDLLKEYRERKTKVSQSAKDADSLSQIIIEWMLMWRGNKLAKMWFESDFKDRVPHFFTKSAKQIAMSLKKSNPNEWWWSEFLTKDGKAKNLKHLLGKNHK